MGATGRLNCRFLPAHASNLKPHTSNLLRQLWIFRRPDILCAGAGEKTASVLTRLEESE